MSRPGPAPPAAAIATAVAIPLLLARDKRELGRAISLCEDSRPGAAAARAALIAGLAREPGRRRARLVGLTGAPGVGKSTLLGEIATRLVAGQPSWAVCALAIDPTSAVSGGALLGDRVRVRFPPDQDRLFFRSQASDLAPGGLGRHTFAVCRLLQHLFDCVLVETVGVGQGEVDVAALVDRTYLVLAPDWGDAVQAMKAGVMEIPDAIVLAKQDLPAAGDSAAALELEMALRRGAGGTMPVHRVSARTGAGIDALVGEIAALAPAPASGAEAAAPLDRREPGFFARWVEREYGRSGAAALAADGGAAAYLRRAGGYDAAIAAFPSDYRVWLAD